MFFCIFLYCRIYNYTYLCTNKGKNVINRHKVNYSNFANLNFAACNVDKFTTKLKGALYVHVGFISLFPISNTCIKFHFSCLVPFIYLVYIILQLFSPYGLLSSLIILHYLQTDLCNYLLLPSCHLHIRNWSHNSSFHSFHHVIYIYVIGAITPVFTSHHSGFSSFITVLISLPFR